MKRLVYLALFVALPMLAIGQSAVGHYTYSHAWSYKLHEDNINVTESGTMDFYPDGSASDSALQHYVVARPNNSRVYIDFDYLSPSYWRQNGKVLTFWGDSACFFMVPVKVQVEYPAGNVSDSARKADKRAAYELAWEITRLVRGGIHKPYDYEVTRLDNQALDFSYTYPDNHSDNWHLVRVGNPRGKSASEKTDQRHLNLVDPSALERRAERERDYQHRDADEVVFDPTFPKTNNFVLGVRFLPRSPQYDFSFSYLRHLGGVQYIGFGGSFGILNDALYHCTYGAVHMNLKTLFAMTGFVQPYLAFELGYQFSPSYTGTVLYCDGCTGLRKYYPLGGYVTPMLGFDFLLGESRTRLSLAIGFQIYSYDNGTYRRSRGDFMTQLGFWF